jgi:formylglycine-generating enzyme required for sulfatase activity
MTNARWTVLSGLLVLPASLFFSAAHPAQSQPPAAAPGKTITNGIGMKLVPIPAGKFVMGSPAGEAQRDEEEIPHEVTIGKPFFLGAHEVTQREYIAVMGSGSGSRPIFTEQRGGGPDHPMDNVKWSDASAFCAALSGRAEERNAGRRYRLPTEAEWEYACRAGTTTPFHVGDSLSAKQANFNGQYPYGEVEKGPYLRRTARVGSYPPNAWGLHDMHGNVAEWCSDYFDKDYYKKSPKEDPKGPASGVVSTEYTDFFRVIRGGSWLDEARGCRSAYRFRAMPLEPNRLIGFRVVCEIVTENP